MQHGRRPIRCTAAAAIPLGSFRRRPISTPKYQHPHVSDGGTWGGTKKPSTCRSKKLADQCGNGPRHSSRDTNTRSRRPHRRPAVFALQQQLLGKHTHLLQRLRRPRISGCGKRLGSMMARRSRAVIAIGLAVLALAAGAASAADGDLGLQLGAPGAEEGSADEIGRSLAQFEDGPPPPPVPSWLWPRLFKPPPGRAARPPLIVVTQRPPPPAQISPPPPPPPPVKPPPRGEWLLQWRFLRVWPNCMPEMGGS